MMMTDKNKYQGQALAITMIVLVVSALLGLSIYSRSLKDQILTMEERASAEALEITDVVLDKLTIHSINEVVNEMVEVHGEALGEEGIVLTDSKTEEEITELFQRLGLLGGASTVSSLLSPVCPVGEEEGNQYQLTIKEADEDTWLEIPAGIGWGLPAGDLLKGEDPPCELNLNVEPRGSDRSGFVVIKIYCNYDDGELVNCDEYELRSFDKHCFSSDDIDCNNDNFEGIWERFNPGGDDRVKINMSALDAPTEIRVIPVGSTIAISYGFDNDACLEGLRLFQLRATANCFGVYRGKELLIPEREWHDPIFDYVIFNNEGSI